MDLTNESSSGALGGRVAVDALERALALTAKARSSAALRAARSAAALSAGLRAARSAAASSAVTLAAAPVRRATCSTTAAATLSAVADPTSRSAAYNSSESDGDFEGGAGDLDRLLLCVRRGRFSLSSMLAPASRLCGERRAMISSATIWCTIATTSDGSAAEPSVATTPNFWARLGFDAAPAARL